MNKRLQQFLTVENITQSQFADRIGVAKASVSHILAGRNRPGFDFIESMASCYPNLNLEWLITGKGKMYKGQESIASSPEISQPADKAKSPVREEADGQLSDSHEPNLFSEVTEETDNKQVTPSVSPSVAKPEPPRIKKILIFYDNGTFKEIE